MTHLQSFLIGALAIIITFGLAVFVHEFGHMMFAIIRGVGVESFAIGMGPKICSWRWHDIDFSLRWFPVGGFVKLGKPKPLEAPATEEAPAAPPSPAAEPAPAQAAAQGEGEANAAPAGETGPDGKTLTEESYDDLLALSGKGFITKILVFGGGVFMNFVTAIVATALLLFIGQELPRYRYVLDDVPAGSPAFKAGLRAGDQIVGVNGKKIEFLDEFNDVVNAEADAKRLDLEKAPLPLALSVKRGSQTLAVNFGNIKLPDYMTSLSVAVPPLIGMVVPHSPAEKAGLQEGDRILSVDGKPVAFFGDLHDIIGPKLGKKVAIQVLRGAERKVFTAVPNESLGDPSRGGIGIVAGAEVTHIEREPNLLKAIVHAPLATVVIARDLVVMQVSFFKKATVKQVGENLGGPIAIADLTQRMAREGFRRSLDWFIKLNLLLMIFNLLPLPVLDGGFILLAAIEGVLRRPVSPRILQPIYTVFVFFFIGLMVIISLLDIKRFFF